jgi:hypothetical protein
MKKAVSSLQQPFYSCFLYLLKCLAGSATVN